VEKGMVVCPSVPHGVWYSTERFPGLFLRQNFLNVTKALYVASSGEIIISSMVIKPTYNNKKARAS